MTASILAGAARVSIAPRKADVEEGVFLGGFGAYRERRATGLHDDPECRAIALSDGNSALVLAALDLVGASGSLLDEIRAEAARLTGIPATNILLACTHSHASPDAQGLWGGIPQGYRRYLADRACGAIQEAQRSLAPARTAGATTTLAGVVRNRRGWRETDEALTCLRFTAAAGAPIATLVNYACHPTASGPANTEVSRDWCGYAVDAIEREMGGIAVYANGAIGDVNPTRDGGFEAAQSLGEAVAGRAIEAMRDAAPVGGALSVRMERLDLAMSFERLSRRVEEAVGRAGPALSLLRETGGLRGAARALHAARRPDLAQLVAALELMSERKRVQRDGQTYLPTQCGYLHIGDDLEALAAPGEVLTRLALPLRDSLRAAHRIFLGLTHDTLGYFVPEDEWMTGRNNNYEESVSPGKHAGSALAEALAAMVPRAPEKR